MKKTIIISVLLYFSLLFGEGWGEAAFAQTDKFWVVGRNCNLDFRSGTPVTDTTNYANSRVLPNSCTNISDGRGNLLFYSDGYEVINKNYQVMPNGNNFNHGTFANPYISGQNGYPTNNCAVIVPFVKDTNLFYMFYANSEFAVSGLPDRLQYLVVDKRLDGGLGDVVFKDSVLIIGDTLANGNVFAIRHGNGKDWWIIARKHHSNQFYMILVDSAGPHPPIIQHLGTPFMKDPIYHCYSYPSIDGTKLTYMYGCLNITPTVKPGQLDIYDFDRCNGAVSNYQMIQLSTNIGIRYDTFPAATVILSPNNRFAYIHNGGRMFQLDLQNPNPFLNKILVGSWDGTSAPSNTLFWQMKNALDGKIYVSTYGGTQYIHVINHPDLLDTFCNFKQRQILFGTLGYYGNGANSTTAHFSDGGLPNTPNYALGKINCGVGVEEVTMNEKRLTVYPNPTNDKLIVENLNTGKNEIFITNLLGEEMQHLFTNNTKTEIDVSCFANGIYMLKVVNENGEVQTKKIVKE